MFFDWFTVGAQVLNFIILVFLMSRFLYRPVLRAIDAREKRIAAELSDADAARAQARKEREEYQQKNEDFAQQRAALLRKATDEAAVHRQRLIEEARQAADTLTNKRRDALHNEATSLNQAIGARAQQEVFAIARKVLTDLAGADLEQRLAEVFTHQVRSLDSSAKASLADAFETSAGPTLVRSAFELQPEQQCAIQNAINETFSGDIHLLFETSPPLVGGIELSTNGVKVGWTIAEYLTVLEDGVEELLKSNDMRAASSELNVGVSADPRPHEDKLGTLLQ